MDASLPDGTIIGDRWRIIGVLGEGGFGQVFLAEDISEVGLGRAAVKVLHPNTSPLERDSFLTEVKKIALLRHQNLVGYLDSGQFQLVGGDVRPYLVAELCDRSLADHLARAPGGRLPTGEVITVLGDVMAGLAHLHARDLIHRDIKPANVLYADGSWKLADFGLMRDLSATGTYHRGELLIGSPLFMAPELFSTMMATAPSDVYAFGVLAHYCASGGPLHGGAGQALVHNITSAAPVVDPSIDPLVRDLILRATCMDPATRPTAVQLRELIARSSPDSSITVVSGAGVPIAPGAAEVGFQNLDRRWFVPTAIGVALLTLLGVGLLARSLSGEDATSDTSVATAVAAEVSVGEDVSVGDGVQIGEGVEIGEGVSVGDSIDPGRSLAAVPDPENHMAEPPCVGEAAGGQITVTNWHQEPVDYRVTVNHYDAADVQIVEAFDTVRALPAGRSALLNVISSEEGGVRCELVEFEVTTTDPASVAAKDQAALVACDLDEFFGNWYNIVFTVSNPTDTPVDADVSFAVVDADGLRIDDSFEHSVSRIGPGETVRAEGPEVFWNMDEVENEVVECIITSVDLSAS